MKKPNIQNILVPIDFSKLSGPAIETAKDLARRFDAMIHLAHVFEFHYPAGFIMPVAPVPAPIITYHDNAEKRLSRDLKMLAKRHGLPGENCQTVNGTPTFHEICNLAQMIPADLIVMPTHGYTGIDHLFEGSVAERVVQHSPCPVLVARQTKRSGTLNGGIDTILVPVDFSHSSFQALEYAIQFAERVAARLVIFHAVHLGYTFPVDGYAMYDLSAIEEAARKNAERQIQEFVRLAKFHTVKFDILVKAGLPVDAICDVAKQRGVDLIITATHGRTGFKHLLMGSVAEQIVRRAPLPVLVVPSHPEMRAARLTGDTQRGHRSTSRPTNGQALLISGKRVSKRSRKLLAHPFPERRKTNKFRESHSERAKKRSAFSKT